MKFQTKYKRQIKKYQALHKELETMLMQLFAMKDRALGYNEFEELLRAFTHSEYLNKSMLKEAVYKDCICFTITSGDNEVLATKIYNTDGSLRFNKKNTRIEKIKAEDGKLFYREMAFGIKTIKDKQKWGILNINGKFFFEPCYKYIRFGLQVGMQYYFIAENRLRKEGLIDCNKNILLPFEFDSIQFYHPTSKDDNFIAEKGEKHFLYQFKDDVKLLDEFDQFDSVESFSFIAAKNGLIGWYDHHLNPILPCEYKKLKVFPNKNYIYNGKYYAIATDTEGKSGIYNANKSWLLPCIYDRIIFFDNEEFTILVNGRKSYLYHFTRTLQIELPQGIFLKSIKQFTDNRKWYYTAQNTKSKMWAVYDSSFNQLTGFHFLHSPEFMLYVDKVIVFIREVMERNNDIHWKDNFEFSTSEFFKLFGKQVVKSKKQFLKGIDRTPVKTASTSRIVFSYVEVAGVYYYDAYKIAEHINFRDELIMVGEPENPHDEFAIALYYKYEDKEYKLGYIPRHINQEIRSLIAGGLKLKIIVRVVNIEGTQINIIFDVVKDKIKEDKS